MGYLRDTVKRAQFDPGFVGVFTNPFYHSRRALARAMKDFSPQLTGKLLDVGCGDKPYRSLLGVDEYVGMEIESERARTLFDADVYYDGRTFPFTDGSFDSVLANEVLEHVFNPEEFMAEIVRVLRPGGKLVMTVPFVWDEHEQPVDYARYTSFGLRHLVEAAGFRVLEQRKTVTDIRALFQLLNEYIYKITYVQNPVVRQVLNTLLIAPVTVLSLLVYWMLPMNPDLYLDNVILAEKPVHG